MYHETTALKITYEHLKSSFTCPRCMRLYELDANQEETPCEVYSEFTCEFCGESIRFHEVQNILVLKDNE